MNRIWVSKIINTGNNYGIPTYVLSNILTVGAPPIILTILFFRFSDGASDIFTISQILLAVLWSSIGYIVWYYDTTLLDDFVKDIEEIIENKEQLEKIQRKYTEFFRREYYKTVLVYGSIPPILFFANLSYFQSQGVGEFFSLPFIIYFLFVIWTSIFSGLGIHLVLTTLLLVSEISKSELTIDPLHFDGLGGLGIIGDFCVSTMAVASFGALGFPYAFALAREATFDVLVYIGVGIYIIILISIFIYPTLKASKKAERRRETQLNSLRKRITKLESELESYNSDRNGPSQNELEKELRLQRLRKKYSEYDNVRLYPVSIGTLTRFAGSVLLPLFFILLEFYIPKLL